MTGTSNRTGSCVCGGVKISAGTASNSVGACHCGTCRKWGGGPFMELNCGTDVTFEGEENISVYDSSEWAERGFCSKCGTHLFYRLKGNGEHMVTVGLFEDQSNLTFESQVFIDTKPDYYNFTEKTHDMTGAELFAQFGGEPD
ncbi:GFA family protein [Parasphingorhabdus halotolerans]|uniref:GFA family protein n=1 Tax=Parasphingorhabdus halotolerans TaxID=2725558 RepID=A0A6H2DJW9_9SPHN|nr:GFA family protein [Parasphingorhabdus halotolerans]QJB68634.1 GFA family protein [Parasphingorhabdus halotolerans]